MTERRLSGRRRRDRLVPVLASAVVVLLGICAVLSYVAFSTAARQDSAIRGSCERLQGLRDDVNIQADGQYDVILGAAQSAPPEARRLYLSVAAATVYSPPVDCSLAVDDPGNYRAPKLVPWAKIDACFSPSKVRVEPPCRARHSR